MGPGCVSRSVAGITQWGDMRYSTNMDPFFSTLLILRQKKKKKKSLPVYYVAHAP